MLGSGINPESFKQDFSGFANAAAIQAQGIANLGQSIGGAIQDYGKIKKQQQQDERDVQKSTSVAKAIGDLVPELKPTLENSLMLLNNKEIPLSQRKAEADAISDILTLGIGAITNKQKLDLERAQIEAATNEAKARAANKPMTLAEIAMGGGKQQVMLDPTTGVAKPITLQGFDGQPQQASVLGNLPQPLKPYAKAFEEAGVKYGVPPALLAAISMHETGGGTSSAFRNKNNAMGISDSSGPIQVAKVEDSIERMANLLGRGINQNTGPYAGVKTVEDIGRIYAPVGASNDPRNLNPAWSQGVTSQLQKLMQTQQPAATASQERIGFTPDKPEKTETFRPATPEESAMYGGMPGQMSSTGKFIPINLPSGFSIEQTPEGGLKVVQGAGVGGKTEGVAKAQTAMKEESFRLNQANTEEAFARLDTAGTNNPVFAAGNALLATALPATEVGELEGFYTRINDENSFIKMNQLRASSPTGGAAGTMTEKEWPKFQGRFSPLRVNAKKDTIAKSLSLNLLNAFEATNGTPDDVIKLLEDKKIDQATFDNYVQEYLTNRKIARVGDEGVEGASYDWTKINKELLKKSTTNKPVETGVGLTPEANANLDALGIPRQSTN